MTNNTSTTASSVRRNMSVHGASPCAGFTLIEFLLGGLVLAIAITAILGAYIGQVTLNEHARNLSLAIQDANRVIEQIRQDTATGCTSPPNADAPTGVVAGTINGWLRNGWDTWLNTAPNTKSIQPNPGTNELVVVTCQNNATAAPVDCDVQTAGVDPLRVTVAICWRHRNRTIGECDWDGVAMTPDDTNVVANDTANVIDSPAMLTTLITCRG